MTFRNSPRMQRRTAHPSGAESHPASRAGGRPLALVAVLALALTFAVALRAGPPAGAADGLPGQGFLPDGRAWEMVSPPNKNGADIEIDSTIRASESGDALTYTSFANFAGGLSGAYRTQSLSTRGAGGWSAASLTPPQDPAAHPSSLPQDYQGFSNDLARGVTTSWAFEGIPGAAHMRNLFLYDGPSASFELLSRPFAPIPPSPSTDYSTQFQGGSDGFEHVVFGSGRALTADAPPEVPGEQNVYLYEWFDGTLRLASVLPAGEGGGPVSFGELGRVVLGRNSPEIPHLVYPGDGAISDDGSRIFFSTIPVVGSAPGSQRVYMREDADLEGPGAPITVRVSASERTDCAGDPSCGGDGIPDPAPDPNPSSSVFELASRDGSVAFFTSIEKLTDDATAGSDGAAADLYRWDATAPAGKRLTDLTTSDPDGGGVLGTADTNRPGVVGAAEDGSRVYFIARGDLAPGATDGAPNLYLWQLGAGVTHVATLGEDDDGVWIASLGNGIGPRFKDARVSADGGRIVFRSSAQLTSYDNDGHFQIYLYDVAAGELSCVSCSPLSPVSTGDAWFKRRNEKVNLPPWLARNLTADGERVFFDSSEPLVTGDSNGRIDVYEWRDGQVHLISSGRSSEDAAFVDASSDGDDVFFTTRQRLVGGDRDSLVDVYDARVGGGFEEPADVPECTGDDCQGLPAEGGGDLELGTATFDGPGDQRPGASTRFAIAGIGAAQRRRFARTGRVTLRVVVPRPGRLVATSNHGGRRILVARRPGAKRLVLRLPTKAKRSLRRTGRLRVRISVRFQGSVRSTAMTLRRAR